MTDISPGGTSADEPAILQQWSCYVDGITPTHVQLVMKDAGSGRSGEETLGTFPIGLLSHLEYGRGTYLTVTARADKSLTIDRTPEQYGPPSSLHLVELLRRLASD